MSLPARHAWRSRWFLGVGAGLVLAGVGVAAWRYYLVSRSTEPARPLSLVVSGDTAGWIVPCGCTANQSGGLLRRGTYLKELTGRAEIILADAGGAPGGTSLYHRARFEAILRGEMAMGLTVHNLGGPEAALGPDYLRGLARDLHVPFLSANLRDPAGELVAMPVLMVERAGQRVAMAGVLSRRFECQGLQVDDPSTALLTALGAVKGRYDSLVVLAYMPEEELRQLAAGLPEADAVIGGPTGQSIAPESIGPTVVAAATNKGKFLIHLEAAARGARTTWAGQVVEMDDKLADDTVQQANLRAFLDELARRDFAAAETGLAPALPTELPPDYRLAGGQSCRSCHHDDCSRWDRSNHAHAWETLAQRGFQVDASCQVCHTTGFGMPGGFISAKRTPDAGNVGCESCHGPSLAHMRDPRTHTAFAAGDQCQSCHDRENSPTFAYRAYWPRIRHGKALAVGGPPTKE